MLVTIRCRSRHCHRESLEYFVSDSMEYREKHRWEWLVGFSDAILRSDNFVLSYISLGNGNSIKKNRGGKIQSR